MVSAAVEYGETTPWKQKGYIYLAPVFVKKDFFFFFFCCCSFDHIGEVLFAVVHLMNGSILEFPSAYTLLAGHFSHCALGVDI